MRKLLLSSIIICGALGVSSCCRILDCCYEDPCCGSCPTILKNSCKDCSKDSAPVKQEAKKLDTTQPKKEAQQPKKESEQECPGSSWNPCNKCGPCERSRGQGGSQ